MSQNLPANLTIDAFAHSAEALDALAELAKHRKLQRCKLAIKRGDIDEAKAYYAGSVNPAIIIVEDDRVEQLDRLADVCDPGTKVIVVGTVNDIQHYRSLMSKGVADYLLRPLSPEQVINALERLYGDPRAAPKGKVVSFFGARGGTGSSCLAQNMAWLMGEQLQESVLYIDCDLSFGSSQVALGLDARQTLADVISHSERLDQVLVERSLNAHGTYLRVLASPGDLHPLSSQQSRSIGVDSIDLLLDIARRMAPVVVLDLPHVWTDWTEHLLRMSSDVVVTAWPDFSSIKNAKALIEALGVEPGKAGPGSEPVKLVLNGVDAYKRTQLAAKDFEDTLGLKPVASIPFEPGLFGEAANTGQIAAQMLASHKVVKLLAGVSHALCGKAAAPRAAKASFSVFDWLKA